MKTLALLILLLASTVHASTICRTYPADAGKAIDATMAGATSAGSVSVEKTSGSGAVGSYDVTSSNSGQKYFAVQTINTESITTTTNTPAEYLRVRMTVAPDSGTIVKVCLHVNALIR